MSSKTIFYLFVAVIVVGLADAGYLSLTTYFAISPVCGPLHGCETVAQSAYSRVFGVPLSYAGVLYYFLGACMISSLMHSALSRKLTLLYAGVGTLASIAFLYIQAVLIKALCVYCVISALATFVLLALSYVLYKKLATPPAPLV